MATPTTQPARSIHDVIDDVVAELMEDSRPLLAAAGHDDPVTLGAVCIRILARIGLGAVLSQTRRGRPDTRSLAVVVLLAAADGSDVTELERVPVRELVHAQTGEPVDVQGLARALSPRVPDDLSALDARQPAPVGADVLAAFLGERRA